MPEGKPLPETPLDSRASKSPRSTGSSDRFAKDVLRCHGRLPEAVVHRKRISTHLHQAALTGSVAALVQDWFESDLQPRDGRSGENRHQRMNSAQQTAARCRIDVNRTIAALG